MSTLLSKKYDVINRQSSVHKDRTEGKKSDIDSIKKRIDEKLNKLMRCKMFASKAKDIKYAENRMYTYIESEMNELQYYIESYHIRKHVHNHARSTKKRVELTIDKILNVLK